jgi:hypothetical protein
LLVRSRRYSDGLAGECVKCPAGTFLEDDGESSALHISASSCLPCIAGKYQANNASNSCEVCPSGRYSNSSSTICTKCPAGTSLHDDGVDAMSHNSVERCNTCAKVSKQ